MRKLFLLYIMLCALGLFASCTNSERRGYEYHNIDVLRMSLSELEEVARVSKCKDCRYDALYRLYHTYKNNGKLYTLYDFAMKFPHCEFADSALAIVLPECDSLYLEARRQNTIDAWSDFVFKVPEPLQRDALDAIDSLKWESQKDKWNTDDKAWQKALQTNQLPSYNRYLSLYPNGAHVAQAIQKIEKIEDSRLIQQHRQAYKQAAYEERQRQKAGDIRNLGVWSVVDSLMAKYGYPSRYHYESKGNSGLFLGEQYTHTYTVGEGQDKPLSEIKKIYMKDYYKLWINKHFDILIQFQWKSQNIIVQHTTTDGRLPKSLMNENGTVTLLPSYKSVLTLAFEKQNKKR